MTTAPDQGRPEWAAGMTDLHVHAAPSLLPRHGNDAETRAAESRAGFATIVLKSHEGSTVERAAALGAGVYGGIVLNSPVGGANPDAVEVAARLGGRVVWMPTVSAPNHKRGASSPELSVHRGFELRAVEVVDDDGGLLPAWHDVLDVIAAHDLLLASGHLSADETVRLFGRGAAPRRAAADGEPSADGVPALARGGRAGAAGARRPPRAWASCPICSATPTTPASTSPAPTRRRCSCSAATSATPIIPAPRPQSGRGCTNSRCESASIAPLRS